VAEANTPWLMDVAGECLLYDLFVSSSFFFTIMEKGENMENQITCPRCKRIIANNPIIEDAAKRVGSNTQSIRCECGERITYWHITAQLQGQKKSVWKIQHWLHGLSKG
jgi:hypothetical protein